MPAPKGAVGYFLEEISLVWVDLKYCLHLLRSLSTLRSWASVKVSTSAAPDALGFVSNPRGFQTLVFTTGGLLVLPRLLAFLGW